MSKSRGEILSPGDQTFINSSWKMLGHCFLGERVANKIQGESSQKIYRLRK